jgi:hypothetical protein
MYIFIGDLIMNTSKQKSNVMRRNLTTAARSSHTNSPDNELKYRLIEERARNSTKRTLEETIVLVSVVVHMGSYGE